MKAVNVEGRLPQMDGMSCHAAGDDLFIEVPPDHLRYAVMHLAESEGMRLMCMHATDARPLGRGFLVHALMSAGNIVAHVTSPLEHETYPSLSVFLPVASRFEREIRDMLGLEAEDSADKRRLVLHDKGAFAPLRKDFAWDSRPDVVPEEYEFQKVDGEGVFEIPVGPVHAGVIEPGHFRFSVAGEPVQKLEIRLGYVHKGVEKLSERMPYRQGAALAERVSGDNGVAHALAYCQAVEGLADVEIPDRARSARVILAELERLHCHFGDIGGIALDTAFSVPAAALYHLRERALDLNERVSGSRLLRSMVVPGGLRRDLSDGDLDAIRAGTVAFKLEFDSICRRMLRAHSFLERVEGTGVLTQEAAVALGVVGPAARASGLSMDVRRDRPYAAYGELSLKVPMGREGDVAARMLVKMEEVAESMSLIDQAIGAMRPGPVRAECAPGEGTAFSLTESHRGETLHWIMSGDGRPYRHKIRDASFMNWPALEAAVPNNMVPDFPLINKSFNLSYSGNDL